MQVAKFDGVRGGHLAHTTQCVSHSESLCTTRQGAAHVLCRRVHPIRLYARGPAVSRWMDACTTTSACTEPQGEGRYYVRLACTHIHSSCDPSPPLIDCFRQGLFILIP